MIDLEEQFEPGDLPERWAVLDKQHERVDEVDRLYRRGVNLTDRRFDEQFAAGVRVYTTVNHLIYAAREGQAFLEATLSKVGLYPTASWNVIRPTFESCILALWTLDPDDRSQRLQRGMSIVLSDHKGRQTWMNEFISRGIISPDDAQSVQEDAARNSTTYRREVDELGIPWHKVTSRPAIVDIIPKIRMLTDLGMESLAYIAGSWRHLSGMEHGQPYAVFAASDVHAQERIRGGFQGVIATSDRAFYNACLTSALLQQLMMSAFIQRTTLLSRSP